MQEKPKVQTGLEVAFGWPVRKDLVWTEQQPSVAPYLPAGSSPDLDFLAPLSPTVYFGSVVQQNGSEELFLDIYR